MTIEVRTHVREKCRFCKIYLVKDCLNDICLECSKKQILYSKNRE